MKSQTVTAEKAEYADPYPYGDYPDGIDEMADDREWPGIFVWLWQWIRGRAY